MNSFLAQLFSKKVMAFSSVLSSRKNFDNLQALSVISKDIYLKKIDRVGAELCPLHNLTLSQTSPGFYLSAVKRF